MTVSRRSVRAAAVRAAFSLCALWLAAGCAGTAPQIEDPLAPLPRTGARMPDDLDLAGRDLALGVLLGDARAVDDHTAEIVRLDADARARTGRPSGVVPYALDARNALLEDPRAYRAASHTVLERDDLERTLRARLEQDVQDDPLLHANARLRDESIEHWGGVFNALVEPVGRSMSNWMAAPARLSASLLNLAVSEYNEDELTLRERQALDHWKQYVEEYPDAPETPELIARIEAAQLRWFQTRRDRHLRNARKALEAGDPLLAALMAERALRYSPEDPEVQDALLRAQAEAVAWYERREATIAVSPGPQVADPGQRELAVALLAPDGNALEVASDWLEREPQGPFADEAAFALAAATHAAGQPDRGFELLVEMLDREHPSPNMGRHARQLLFDPRVNPYGAFRVARGDVNENRLKWLAFGPLAGGARDRNLPRPVEWLVEVPSVVGVASSAVARLIKFPFMETDWSKPAVPARRYLVRYPDGEHADELRDWLRDYEEDRGNYVSALKLAEASRDVDADQLAELREKAAEQALQGSLGQKRRDLRHQLLRETAQTFQGTEAGLKAGAALRADLERAAPQRIRISRGFLEENPAVAGPEGLALRPGLIDGDPSNGELHPHGVTLLGGRVIEINLLGESARDSQPPHVVKEKISEERLARAVAQLEEAQLQMALTDKDVQIDPDPDRDAYFERARLGALDQPDLRANAQSTYEFLGVREKYGLVRSRDSLLPVELVLQGNLTELGLGAFPRMRRPKRTPDSFLYED